MIYIHRSSKEVSVISRVVASSLKSISQVIFIENSISGLLILMGIFIADNKLGLIAIVSAIVGNLIATIAGGDKDLIDKGLLGYNSVLIGLALPLFLNQDSRFMIAMLGAILAAIFTLTMIPLFSRLDIPILTFPYVVLTWFFLLASDKLQTFQLMSDSVTQVPLKGLVETQESLNLLNGLIGGIGQVYFQSNIWTGLFILVGIYWASRRIGIYAVLGTFIGWITALILGAEHSLMNVGLYGFNAVLAVIRISEVFDSDCPLSKLTGIMAAIFTVPLTTGIHSMLSVFGLPVLSMPFILVTWILLGARKVLPRI